MITEKNKGVKNDNGKTRMSLLPFDALVAVAEVMTEGARKYNAHNWKYVDNAEERYMDAMLRHIAAIQQGEEINYDDYGLSHIAHVATNALFLLHFYLEREKKIDKSGDKK